VKFGLFPPENAMHLRVLPTVALQVVHYSEKSPVAGAILRVYMGA
jgi:hypothetical protein